MKSKRPPRISDIARLAGVSTATVSRALNNPDSVARETRELVLQTADKHGYSLNVAARNLRQGRAGAIVVCVPNLGNPFFAQILAGIETVLAQRDFSVVMVDTAKASAQSAMLPQYLNASRADGVISLDGTLPLEAFQRHANMPIAFACEWPSESDRATVRSDNQHGAALAIRHLAELGHTKIGFVGGPGDNILAQIRYEATQATLRDLGLEAGPTWLFPGDFTLEGGSQAAEAWLRLHDRPTALFCVNDETAFGVISHLHQSGISVPEQLSVVGFDDIEISKHFIPALTTVHQLRFELGTNAAELLLQQIDEASPDHAGKHVVLPVSLVVRASTAAPNPTV